MVLEVLSSQALISSRFLHGRHAMLAFRNERARYLTSKISLLENSRGIAVLDKQTVGNSREWGGGAYFLGKGGEGTGRAVSLSAH